jgi:ABC-type multidrug transport system fused ATPase/permease subunit
MSENQAKTYVKSFRICFALLSNSDKNKIYLIFMLQIALAIIDLLGLAVIGLLASLTATGIVNQNPRGLTFELIKFLNLESLRLNSQILIFSFFALSFFTFKSISSIYLNRKIIFFMGRKSAEISSDLLLKLIGQPLQHLQKYSVQETIYLTTSGLNRLFNAVITNSMSLIVDIFLIILMIGGVIFIDPIIGAISLVLFVVIGVSLHFVFRFRAKKLGILETEKSIRLNQMTHEILNAYRELLVRNRRFYYANAIGQERISLSNISSRLSFLPFVGKYVMEIGLLFGVFIVALLQFTSQDLIRSVSVLALFLAASTRIAPAVLRVQQNLLILRSNMSGALSTVELIESTDRTTALLFVGNVIKYSHKGFIPKVTVDNINFTYPTRNIPAIKSATFEVESGEFVAIIGPSGSGKSTLVDLILGVLTPSSGCISIGNNKPLDAIRKWPGAIAYVPQNSFIIQGSIRENITLGFPNDKSNDEKIWEALEVAQLANFVKSLPLSLDNYVGDGGVLLSGGQRQRLGIARSLLTKPKFLILDESTSSLDMLTESELLKSILSDKHEMTVISIAHRLSTVKQASKIIYISDGEILCIGTFDEIRKKIPYFENQLKILEK